MGKKIHKVPREIFIVHGSRRLQTSGWSDRIRARYQSTIPEWLQVVEILPEGAAKRRKSSAPLTSPLPRSCRS